MYRYNKPFYSEINTHCVSHKMAFLKANTLTKKQPSYIIESK